jgi:MFS family permease
MKNFFIKTTLLLASMMTMMAGAIVAPSLPQISEYFIEYQNIEILSKLIITLPALFIAIASPIVGILIDKIGRKNILLYSLILYGLSGSSVFLFANLNFLLITRAFLGIAVAGIMTVTTTLIGDYFDSKERNSFVGIQGAFMGIGGVIFISLSGILADISWQLPFLIYGFAFPVLILAVFFLYEPDIVENLGDTEAISDKRIPYFKSTIVYLLIFLSIVFFYIIPVQIPFVLNKIDGVNNAMIGYAISISTLASAIISMNYKQFKKRYSFPTIYFLAFLFMGVGYMIISLSDLYWQIITGLVISGFGTGLIMPSGSLWIIELAPSKFRGRMIGIAATTMYLGQFISPLFLQPIINQTSVASSFYLVAIFMISVGIIVVLSYKLLKFINNIIKK